MRIEKSVGLWKSVLACALVLCCVGAYAQEAAPGVAPGAPGAAPARPETMVKAWDIQATSVAKSLALTADQTTKLVDAYKAARESYESAFRAKMTGGGRPDMNQLKEVNQAERTKLETALKGFLNEEQTTKALATLGTFNRRWDSMVMTLVDMKLEDKAMADAMKLVSDYVAESDKAMRDAMPGDPSAMREQSGKRRETLDTEMAKILSPEQMAKWQEGGAMRRGVRPRGGAMPVPPSAPAPKPAPAGE